MKLVPKKLNAFLEENGIQKMWFAKKINISANLFYQVLGGYAILPMKCWEKTIDLTGGLISASDLMHDKYEDSEFIQILPAKNHYDFHGRIKGSQ